MRRVRAVLALLSLMLSLWWMGPRLADAWLLVQLIGDPVRLAAHRLTTTATPERLTTEIEAALAAEDPDLAASLLSLADGEGVALDPALRARVEAADAPDPLALAGSFLRGAVVGDEMSVAGLGGAFAGDVVGIGDIRDLSREGIVWIGGGDPDEIVVGLSVVGLAVTGATWGSVGTAAPARAGLTLVKTAKRLGRLSEPFVAGLSRMLAQAVDGPAVKRALTAAADLDAAGARLALRGAVRTEAVGPSPALEATVAPSPPTQPISAASPASPRATASAPAASSSSSAVAPSSPPTSS